MRGETFHGFGGDGGRRISIHSPHARGDRVAQGGVAKDSEFQSTPLMRGETIYRLAPLVYRIYFNPLPSCEGRRNRRRTWLCRDDFNPLPSCEGRPGSVSRKSRPIRFQSTPLMRGETGDIYAENLEMTISIHSPPARGDFHAFAFFLFLLLISIHSPHARGDLLNR